MARTKRLHDELTKVFFVTSYKNCIDELGLKMMKNFLRRPLAQLKSLGLLRSRQLFVQGILASGLIFIDVQAHASGLIVTDGVVVKFGQDAQLIVRDKLTAGKGVVLTSQSDDAAGGQVAATAQTPVAGVWNGLRIEKSAALNTPSFTEMTIRYAGAQGGAGLTVLGYNPTLQFVFFLSIQWDS